MPQKTPRSLIVGDQTDQYDEINEVVSPLMDFDPLEDTMPKSLKTEEVTESVLISNQPLSITPAPHIQSSGVAKASAMILLPDQSRSPMASGAYTGFKSKGRVYVHGYFANSMTKKMFFYMGYDVAKSVSDADIVCWTGGEDINPHIYGEKASGAVGWSDFRDKDDFDIFQQAEGRFKIGICRGAQLLNCLPPNDGRLWQDVDMHDDGDHPVTDYVTGEELMVNSLHHQQLRLSNRGELVAGCNISRTKDSWNAVWHCDGSDPDTDVEVAWYPGSRSLCFQPHPEFDPNGTTGKYFARLLERYYLAA